MRRICIVSVALGCLAAVPAAAEDHEPVAQGADHLKLASTYPTRWHIKAVLGSHRFQPAFANGRFRTLATPPAPTRAIDTAAQSSSERPLGRTLVAGIRRLGQRHWMTLWKGRDTSVVVGLQDGGYIGLSLAENPD